jgi:hypothetical protein
MQVILTLGLILFMILPVLPLTLNQDAELGSWEVMVVHLIYFTVPFGIVGIFLVWRSE